MYGRKVIDKERILLEKARRCLPAGSLGNVYMDVIIRDGSGSKIWDVSGNEYVDYLLGSGPMLVGHSHPHVVGALQEQIKCGTTFFANNEFAICLAEEIIRAVPCAEKVRFSSSGSEATLYAMRLARAYMKRDKILKFEGGFHGTNDYALMSMSPSNPPDFPQSMPDSAGIPSSVQDEVLIAPFNDIDVTSNIIKRHQHELAGVIVEPFQRLIPPNTDFLQGLRDITQLYQIPLIFDEIVTGFRFAYGGAQEYYGVTPDMCALGKVIAGGFPLSAVAGREELMSHMDPVAVKNGDFVPQIGTLSGNPVAARAGLATLEILRGQGIYEKIFDTGRKLKDGLRRLLQEAEIPAQVIGEPPLFDVFFTDTQVKDYRSSLSGDKMVLAHFNRLLLERGVFKGDTKFYISSAHTSQDVDHTIRAFESAIDELKG